MEGIGWCAEAMKAAQARLEVAADNLANAHSEGFHRRVAAFALTDGGLRANTAASASPGALRETGRALDLAIAGRGYVAVAPLHGSSPRALEIAHTRGGSFTRTPAGFLVDEQGRALLGRTGFVRVPDGPLTIGADGTIEHGGQAVDRLRSGARTRIASGFVETSNVDAIAEMVAILDAHRAFETAQKSLTALDIARQKGIDDAGMVK